MVMLNKEWFDRIIILSLCIMILALPFAKTIIEILFVVIFISWFFGRILSYDKHASLVDLFKPVRTELNPFILIFIIAALASIPGSPSIGLSLKGLFSKLLKGAVLYFVMAEIINNKKRLGLILIFIFLSMTLMCVDGLFQRITGWDFLRHYRITGWNYAGQDAIYIMRISASFFNPNGFGAWLIVMIPIALSMAIIDKKALPSRITKSIAWVLVVILTACLILTHSKGALLGFIFAMFFIMIYKKKPIFVVAIIALIASLLFITYYISMHPNLIKIFMGLKNVNSCNMALSFIKDILICIKGDIIQFMLEKDIIRTNLWHEAISIIKKFPMFGCGLNTYSIVAPHFKSGASVAGIYPHNSYLQMAAETGIVGLTSFVLVMARLFITSWKNLKKIKNSFYNNILLGLLAGLFGFLVHSFFDVNLYALQLVNLMWFFIGLAIAVQRVALYEEYGFKDDGA